MSNEFKVCANADCEQKQPIHIDGFSKNKTAKDGLQAWCKDCMSKYKKEWLEAEANRAGQRAYKEGLITKDEIEDAISLFKSCRSRIHSCKYDIGIYANVDCDWDDPYQFMKDILTVRENHSWSFWDKIWTDWKAQRKKYLSTGNEDDKPELDRIHGKNTPYRIGNIRCLSDYWNREYAKPVIPLGIKLYKNGEMINRRHFANYEPAKRWLIEETGCKVGNKKIHEVDEGIIKLSNEFSFEILSLDSMQKEFEGDREKNKE